MTLLLLHLVVNWQVFTINFVYLSLSFSTIVWNVCIWSMYELCDLQYRRWGAFSCTMQSRNISKSCVQQQSNKELDLAWQSNISFAFHQTWRR